MSTRFWFPTDSISPDSEDAFTAEEMREIIDLVRESSFLDDLSGLSVEERLTTVFGGEPPQWSGFQIEDGTCYVNCIGVMTVEDEELEVILQFELSDDLESFVFSGMLIDGIEQPEGLILQFEEQFSTLDWDDDEYDDDEDEDDCDCGDPECHGHSHNHGHEHHHDHGHIFGAYDEYDDDDDDIIGDWGDDAAERFWFDPDNDDWEDDEDHDDGCDCGHHHN